MRFQGWQIEERKEVSSTQEEIRPLLTSTQQEPIVLVARSQDAGRGRRGREWSSPPGGLWCSIAIPRALPVDPFQGLLLAVAARGAIAASVTGGERLVVKWPNDLVTAAPAERKWGGILADVVPMSAESAWVVFGLGVNLDLTLKQLPQTGPEALPATSIRVEFGDSPSPETALLAILTRFGELLQADAESRAGSLATVRNAVATLGRAVQWDESARERGRGRAIDIADDGALIVELPSGERRALRSGEIRHLRADHES